MARKLSAVFLIVFFLLNCVVNTNTILCLITLGGDKEQLLAGIEVRQMVCDVVCDAVGIWYFDMSVTPQKNFDIWSNKQFDREA